MTKEEILNMKAGPEIDVLVALVPMEWRAPQITEGVIPPCPLPDFDYFHPPKEVEEWRNTYFWREPDGGCWERPKKWSENISAAWEVVEKMRKSNWKWFEMASRPTGYKVNFTGDPRHDVYAETAPLAICQAALLAVMEEQKEAAKCQRDIDRIKE